MCGGLVLFRTYLLTNAVDSVSSTRSGMVASTGAFLCAQPVNPYYWVHHISLRFCFQEAYYLLGVPFVLVESLFVGFGGHSSSGFFTTVAGVGMKWW